MGGLHGLVQIVYLNAGLVLWDVGRRTETRDPFRHRGEVHMSETQAATATLYERLGGSGKIVAIAAI